MNTCLIKLSPDAEPRSLEYDVIPGDGDCFYSSVIKAIQLLKPELAEGLTVPKLRYTLQRQLVDIDWDVFVESIIDDFKAAKVAEDNDERDLKELFGYRDPFKNIVNKIFAVYVEQGCTDTAEETARASLTLLGDRGKNTYIKMVGESQAWARALEINTLARLMQLNIIKAIKIEGTAIHQITYNDFGTLQANHLCVPLLSDGRHFNLVDPVAIGEFKGCNLEAYAIPAGQIKEAPLDFSYDDLVHEQPEVVITTSGAMKPEKPLPDEGLEEVLVDDSDTSIESLALPTKSKMPTLATLPLTFEKEKLTAIDFDGTRNTAIRPRAMRHIEGFTISWADIPPFAVITGVNGAGKSYLLEQIKAGILATKSKKVTYLGPDDVESHDSSSTLGGELSHILKEGREEFTLFTLNFINGISNNHKPNKYINKFGGDGINYKNIVKSVANHLLNNIPKLKEKTDLEKRRIIEDECLKPNFITEATEINYNVKTIINSAIEAHKKATEDKKAALKNYSRILDEPYAFWKKANPKGTIANYKDFLKDEDKVNKLIDELVESTMPMPNPLGQINKIFPEKFPYQLVEQHGEIYCYPRGLNSKDEINPTKLVNLKHLSSGEKIIVKVISLIYYNQGMRATIADGSGSVVTKPDIMLLDEPDRSLDPKLCKVFFDSVIDILVKQEGIQVIMVSHRMDTIGLAPEGSIFTIGKNGIKYEVKPVTKMQALLKLTGNLRELNHLRVKVYVEAHDDALFMEGVMESLMRMSDIVREDNVAGIGGKTSMTWGTLTPHVTEPHHSRLLSRRYPLMFVSSGNSGGKDGGARQVEDLVSRDLAFREVHESIHKARETTLGRLHRDTLKVTEAFGVMDYDYGRYKFHNPSKDFQNRFKKLERHSVENYLYDPFMLVATVNLAEISEPMKSICTRLKEATRKHRNEEIQVIVDEYFTTLVFDHMTEPSISSLESNIRKERWSFGDNADPATAEENAVYIASKIIKKAKSLGPDQPYDRDKHFKMLVAEAERDTAMYANFFEDVVTKKQIITKDQKTQFETLCNRVKPESLLHYAAIETHRAARNIHAYGSNEIPVILGANTVVKIKYPTIFLRLRGHNIEDDFPVAEGISKDAFKRSLLMNASKGSYIPFDLAKVFFDLNEAARKQAEVVVRPERILRRAFDSWRDYITERKEVKMAASAAL